MMSSFTMREVPWNLEEAIVKLQERGARFSGLASPSASRRAGPLTRLVLFIAKTFAVADMEVSKLRHDPTELLTRSVQPALWLLIYGEVFTRIRAIPTGGIPLFP